MKLPLLSISQLSKKGKEIFYRFPLTLLASVITTYITIYFIAIESETLDGFNLVLAKLATTGMLGIFVFTSLNLLENSMEKGMQLWLQGFGFLGLIGYYFSLPNDIHDFGVLIYVFRHIFLILLFFISMLWTPFLKSDLSNIDYWEYAKTVIFSLMMTVLFSIIVILGVNIALYAAEELFSINIIGKYYLMLDVFLVGVFSVAYFLSQIPQAPLAVKASLPPPHVEKFFTQYILTSLTTLYFVILYLYTTKILVNMDWPKGILAWLIVTFSIVAVLTYLFWTHFTIHEENKWRKRIWLAVLFQTFMLFAAIAMRILEYSWTENRYMVLLLGVWLSGISLYFLVKKEAKIKWIFISLSMLIAISQMGPFSAYNVSKNAQTNRLQDKLKIFRKIENPAQVPIKIRYEISDAIRYLYTRYGTKELEAIFPAITAEFIGLDSKLKAAQKAIPNRIEAGKKRNDFADVTYREEYQKVKNIFKGKPQFFPEFITDALGFKFINFWDYKNEYDVTIQEIDFQVQHSTRRVLVAQDIKGYDYMINYHGDSRNKIKKDVIYPFLYLENIALSITFEKSILKLETDNEVIVVDIERYMKELVEKHGTSLKQMEQNELTLEKENSILKVKIEFNYLNKISYKNNKNINFGARILYMLKGKK